MDHLYQRQLQYVFDRLVEDPPWYWQPREEECPFGEEEDAMTAFLFYEQLCKQPGLDLAPYSDNQVGQGLTYLFDGSVSNLTHGFKSAPVPAERKAATLRSLSTLFREVFAPRCAQVLSAGSQEPSSPLNYICYMFWDVTPLSGFLMFDNQDALLLYALNNMPEDLAAYMPKEVQDLLKMNFEQTGVKAPSATDILAQKKEMYANMDAETRAYYQAIAYVMESCLYLDNPACIESGLHGLGEMATFQADIVTPIIDKFLDNRKQLDSQLLRYAKAARTGMVL